MMEAQEVEPVLAVIHVHEPRLLQVELEAKLRHHIRHRLIGVADILLCLCDDDEVIGKADQGTEVAVVLLPLAVQHVEVDVGEERADGSALCGARFGLYHVAILHHTCIQP